jgi:glycosyltransferase involved in cell wall biosynthesis
MDSNSKEKNLTDFDPIEVPSERHKRQNLRLGMMHYHLRPGGVTSVMRDMAIALGSHSGYESIRIDVIASVGSEERARRTFAGAQCEKMEQLKIVNVPALAYHNKPYPSKKDFVDAAERLGNEILMHAEPGRSSADCPYIVHSHNISLGKNPVATMAIKLAAEKAASQSLPIWFINQVHDFAENNRPEQMRAFFNCTGRRDETFARSFMYPRVPNMIYLTINSADIGNLIELGIAHDRIFLLPDPIDWRPYAKGPLWENDAAELAAMGLEPANHKELMLQRLANYAASKGQIFDSSRPILLSPLKVMRRKNNAESLLLLALFKHLGTDCQLLISLGASSPPDNAYSHRLLDYAASRNMAVVTGFGHEIISETDRRSARNGIVTRYNMSDLYGLCSAALTTSVVEGFGLAYHEGWLCGKPVIGRKIPEITADFEAKGMNFDHAYEKLSVPLDDLPGLKRRLLGEYEKKLLATRRNWKYSDTLPRLSADDIIDAKLFRVGGQNCIDFADLSLEMQFEMLDMLIDDPAAITRFIDRNPTIALSHKAIKNGRSDRLERLIETNRAVVQKKYSLDAMVRRLENIFEKGDSLYQETCERIPLTVEKHTSIMQRYMQPEGLRLIF